MTEMKKSAERKLAELRGEQQRVEKELYDMRNSVTDAPVTTTTTVNAANKPAAADEADRCITRLLACLLRLLPVVEAFVVDTYWVHKPRHTLLVGPSLIE
jgi:hypothetical protein